MSHEMGMSEGRGFVLPRWFLAAATSAFIGVSIVIGGVGTSTWSKADAAAVKNIEQDDRILALEQTRSDIAKISADLTATRDMVKVSNDQLNRMIDRELARALERKER